MASSSRMRRRISGAKLGMPRNVMSSPSVSASPMRSVPRLGMPTTSPAKASSASERSWAKKNCGAVSAMVLPVRTCFTFMPRVSLPEHTRMKAMRSRWLGSMFAWILKTMPVMAGSVASIVRVGGLAAAAAAARRRSARRACRARRNSSARCRSTPASACRRGRPSRSKRPQALAHQLDLLAPALRSAFGLQQRFGNSGSSGPETGWPSGSSSRRRMRG